MSMNVCARFHGSPPHSYWFLLDVVGQPPEKLTLLLWLKTAQKKKKSAWPELHGVISIPYVFSLLYINNVLIWFIGCQSALFIQHHVPKYHVVFDCMLLCEVQAQNEKNVNSDIYTEVTNYSLTISAFNSVPDNSVSELGKQCLQFVLKLLLFLLIEISKMSWIYKISPPVTQLAVSIKPWIFCSITQQEGML